MTQLSSFQPLPRLTPSRRPTPRPKPSPVPSSSRHYAADALPLPRQGKLPHHHPAVLPRVPDTGPPLFSTPIGPYHTPPPSTMPTLARDTDNSFAPTKLPSGHTGTISTTARCGASVPLRRGETSVQSQRKKSPLEEKHLSFSLSCLYPIVPPTLSFISLFLRPPPRGSFSSTSADSFSLCSKTLFGLSPLVLAPFVSDLLFQGLLPFRFCPSRGRDEQCNVIQVQE